MIDFVLILYVSIYTSVSLLLAIAGYTSGDLDRDIGSTDGDGPSNLIAQDDEAPLETEATVNKTLLEYPGR